MPSAESEKGREFAARVDLLDVGVDGDRIFEPRFANSLVPDPEIIPAIFLDPLGIAAELDVVAVLARGELKRDGHGLLLRADKRIDWPLAASAHE